MAMVKVDPGQGYLWYYTDHLGSSRLVSGNDYSSNDQRRDYAPFGDPKTSSGNDESAYQFTQKELDSNTGLYYFGARYYDPSIGRFISVDPLAEENTAWSPYSYSKNNPLNRIDPDGRNDFLARLAVYFNAESHKTVNDYNNFASSRVVIPQAGIDQSGAETFADAMQFLNDSAEQFQQSSSEVLGKVSEFSGTTAAVCYGGAVLTAWAPPVSTGLAFTGSAAEAISTVSGGLNYALTGDTNDAYSAVISATGMGSGRVISSKLLKTVNANKLLKDSENKIIESGVQAVNQILGIAIDETIEQKEAKNNDQ
jgi:RHS repeat-associated protein